MVAQPLGPVYNNLIVFDPSNYPQIIGDLATSWTVSDHYLAYTFTLHEGMKFHDGSELTSADVKASRDKIVFPPDGVIGPRRSYYQLIKSIEAPDRNAMVFRLHHPSPSFLSNMSHPANFLYAEKYLDSDVHCYKTHIVGTGPFKLKPICARPSGYWPRPTIRTASRRC
ncbi:MAG TPA: ABC transporter substrate-binding protein [Candidatus Tectomicrobia bacterium]